LRSLERAGVRDYCEHRQLHLLSDGFRPDPWLKLIFMAVSGEEVHSLAHAQARSWPEIRTGSETSFDRRMLIDALRAMCLRNHVDAGHFVVEVAVPRSPIVVDVDGCCVLTEGGPLERGRLAYLFPPALAARLRANGIAAYDIEMYAPQAIAEIAARIFDGAAGRRGSQYLMNRRMR
jgi:hypothetical protein